VEGLQAQVINCPIGADQDIVCDTLAPIVNFTTPIACVNPGDQICVDVSVSEFQHLVSFTYMVGFDPTVLQFSAGNDLLVLPQILVFSTDESDQGKIGVLWFNNAGVGICIEDNTSVFEICFDVIGDVGDNTNISITDGNIGGVNFIIEYGVSTDIINEICTNDSIISQPLSIDICCNELNIITSSCGCSGGLGNGVITASACGGMPPYSFDVPGPAGPEVSNMDQEEITLDGIPCGSGTGGTSLTVTVTDALGNTADVVVNVTNDDPITIDWDAIEPRCDDAPNGSITISDISGGSSNTTQNDYQIEWSNQVFNTPEILGLGNGDYEVTITDLNGCQAVIDTTLFTAPIDISIDVNQQPTCDGSMDGILEITATGGTPFNGNEYKYGSQNAIPMPSVQINVESGEFCIDVFDENNCDARLCIDVIAAGGLDTNYVEINNACFGELGSIKIQVVGASTNPSVILLNEDMTTYSGSTQGTLLDTLIVADIAPGIYFVEARDPAVGCEEIFQIEIQEGLPLDVTEIITPPDCADMGGSIVVNATGGIGLKTYLWNDMSTGNTLLDISSGMYSVTVSDALMCDTVLFFDIQSPGNLSVVASSSSASCGDNADGVLDVVVTPPSANQSFEWLDASGTVVGNTQQVSGIGPGTYTVNVTDNVNGCTASDATTISSGSQLSVIINLEMADCPGDLNGSIGASVSGGVMPYSFNWNHPNGNPNNATLAGIGAGNYNLVITDAEGCTEDTMLVLMDPPAIDVIVQGMIDVTCFEGADGVAGATAVGGTAMSGNYNFTWSSSPLDGGFAPGASLASNLESGTQWLLVDDGICSTDTIFFEIGSPEKIMLDPTLSLLTEPTCFGLEDGTASLQATGGTVSSSTYMYEWLADGSNTDTQTNLAAGWHFVLITDDEGCEQIDSIFLDEPDSLVVEINSFTTQEINCNSDNNGVIGLSVTGGNGGEIFEWTDNVSDGLIADNLSPGSYGVTVTDINGCMDVASYDLLAPEPIVATINQPEEPNCFGGRTCITVESVTGGVGDNYRFGINFGNPVPIDSCIEVPAGMYNVMVFDETGCSVEEQIIVTQPDQIIVDLGENITVPLGDTSTLLQLNVTSTLPILAIDWDPIEQVSCRDDMCSIVGISPIVSTLYSVSVLDENGCVGFDEILVTVEAQRNIFIANIFSPNGDGSNDDFRIYNGPGVQEINYFRIFDRWGNQMFSVEDQLPSLDGTEAWDGTFKGTQVMPGVYVYQALVTFIDGREIEYKGSVTVIR
jgi:gliding motility-associated-like protein